MDSSNLPCAPWYYYRGTIANVKMPVEVTISPDTDIDDVLANTKIDTSKMLIAKILGDELHPEFSDAIGKRIVDCVNAMQGIDDPIAFMEKIHAIEHIKDWMNKKSKNSQS